MFFWYNWKYEHNATWLARVVIIAVGCCLIHGKVVFASQQTIKDPVQKEKFVIYDATLVQGKPDLSAEGFHPINVLYVHSFWKDPHNRESLESLPDEALVRRLARVAAAKGDLVVIDIEHWSLDGTDDNVQKNLGKYAQIIDWMHDERPDLKIGYFGIMPLADYQGSRLPHGHVRYKQWQAKNDRLAQLAKRADIIFPYIYTYFEDVKAWRQFAVESINEARRYGKPVYVFLMPHYSEKNVSRGGQYISDVFWRLQLETARCYSDAAVVWTGPDEQWDPELPWWRVTRSVLGDMDLMNRQGCD